MSAVQMFNNGEFELQVTPAGDSFIVSGPSLARALGFVHASTMVRNLPDDEKGTALELSPGGPQVTHHVTEAGFYHVVGQRQPGRVRDPRLRAQVERFQRWVHHEVLPSIRKTGGYQVAPAPAGAMFEPHTLTWDETCALLRQRYGVCMTVVELTRALRTAGVLKQVGGPTKRFLHLLWFTGSAWTVHPHALPEIAERVARVTRELQDFRFLQLRLELEGVGAGLPELP